MSKDKKFSFIFLIIIILAIGLSLNFLFKQMDSKLGYVEIDDNVIKIMNNSYKVEDIVTVELLEKVSLSGGSGSNTPNTNNGRYKVNGDVYESKVHIYKNVSPFIRLITKDSAVVFNKDNPDKTKEIYNELLSLTK
ncbi:MAG: hypothetical protein ACRC92_15560 [Peptostreptococcaceae bacterium]